MSECDQPAGHRDLVATLAALREQCDGSPPDRAAAGPAREFACPNCHGHLGFTGTLTATACPFCAAPVQRADIHAAENHVPVDGIVPFAIDTDAAEAAVRRWLRTVLFAPTAFKRSGTPGSVSAVYLPFFTFDAGTVTNYTGQRGKRISKTVLWRDVAGTVTKVFDDVAVPAEDSMDRKRLRELEPWETSVAVAFRPEFLAGALARRHDRELADCAADAEKLMEAEVCKAICADIGGAEQRITRADPIWSNQVYRHLLLPVFVLSLIHI